jgi:hypothetical protein
VQEGEGIVCLGGTSKAYTVARVVDDGNGSSVIEDAVNTACCCPTPHHTLFIATNSIHVYSCIFPLSERTLTTSWHGEASVGPTAFQGRFFEGACNDGGRVLNKNGKTPMSR